MSKSDCKGFESAGDVGARTDANPTAEPPSALILESGGNTMNDQSPSQNPPDNVQSANDGEANTAPTLIPALDSQSGSDAGIGAWVSDKRVSALWGLNENRNSWVHIKGVGWKKLTNNSDSAVVALTVVSSHAKQTQTTYSYREEADGMIHEAYVW